MGIDSQRPNVTRSNALESEWYSANLPTFLLILAMAALAWIVWPGLRGPLIFDDLTSLAPLLWDDPDYRLPLRKIAGPLGRGITMATFVFNHWSRGELVSFDLRICNLLIHMLNGFLLYRLLGLLLRQQFSSSRAVAMALIVTVWWLLNPVNAGTLLYIIQRATLLSATFVLAGCLCYVRGRNAIFSSRRGRWLALIPCLCCWLLASLSKENGLLLPIYLLIIEFGFFRSGRVLPMPWIIGGALLPIMMFVILVLTPILKQSGMLNYSTRPFNIEQRLLTEPVVLAGYLKTILLPGQADTGLYHDDVTIRTDPRDPASMACGLLLLGLVAGAVYAFHKPASRILGAGILLYFAGHLLESTIFPLELYFPHRNYFPSAGLMLAMAMALERMAGKFRSRNLMIGAGVFYLALNGAQSFSLADIWSSRDQILYNGYTLHPGSLRANLEYTNLQVEAGRWNFALDLNGRFIRDYPRFALPARFQRYQIYCERNDGMPAGEVIIADQDLNVMNPFMVGSALTILTASHERNRCDFINLRGLMTRLAAWVDVQLKSRAYNASELWTIDYYVITYFWKNGDHALALRRLDAQIRGRNPKAGIYRGLLSRI